MQVASIRVIVGRQVIFFISTHHTRTQNVKRSLVHAKEGTPSLTAQVSLGAPISAEGRLDELRILVISDTSCLSGEQGEIRYLFPLNERAHRPGLIGF